MNRRFAAVLASALAAALSAGLAVAVPSAASAETSARSSIRTYTAQFRLDITDIGAAKGISVRLTGHGEAALSPRLALRASTRDTVTFGKEHQTESGQFYLVGDRAYFRDHGARKWTESKIPGVGLRLVSRLINPVADQAAFKAIGHARRVGRRHYRVTGDSRQIRAFLAKELGLRGLSGLGFKTVTINIWDNTRHRPVKMTLATRSSTAEISVAVAISGYNKHLTIRAPR